MSTTPTIHQVQVDDTDPAIRYGPGWFLADPSALTRGNFGPIYNGTSHASSSNSTLSFAFNGTTILVQGTVDVSTDANGVMDPTWNCFVDGTGIPPKTFDAIENNWQLCQLDGMASGSHVLTIQVTSKGRTFYLDSLVYTPTPDTVFESAVLIYPHADPAVNFSSGWKEDGQQLTQTKDAQEPKLTVLSGTSVTMFGQVYNQYATNATSASYTIDGGAPTTFHLPGLPSNQSDDQYNQVIFTVPALSNGPHTLTVTHGGDINHTPLPCHGFWVTNTTSLASQTSVSSFGPSMPTQSPNFSEGTSGRRSKDGAIVGGVVAGLLMLVILTGIYLWHLRRKRRGGTESMPVSPYPMAIADGARPLASLSGAHLEAGSAGELPHKRTHVAQAPAPAVLQHKDSGVRLNGTHSSGTPVMIVELPPGYSPA
ncbi:hypothetical protein C8R44DRAFT_320710 [Mycena epipterygia]|nr:hypothetical protein C8R44DRAFT_320710 [Mycena epipterygia]